ncbi:MAG: hypothetical protein AB8B59_02600 [Maribacter sp.]
MDLPFEVYDIAIAISFVAAGMVLVAYLTRNSTNFRSSRNRKARRQHPR